MKWALSVTLLMSGCGSNDAEPVTFSVHVVTVPAELAVWIDGARTDHVDGKLDDVDLELRSDRATVYALRTDFDDSLGALDVGLDNGALRGLDTELCATRWGSLRGLSVRATWLDGHEDEVGYGCPPPYCDPGDPASPASVCTSAQKCTSERVTADPRYAEMRCADPGAQHVDEACTWHADGDRQVDDCAAGLYCLDAVCRPLCSTAYACDRTCVTPAGNPSELLVCPA